MSVNSYKEDEHSIGTGKWNTLKRLFSYLLLYKKKIAFVLIIMGFCVSVSLLNPLFMEYAIDDDIASGNMIGLMQLILVAVILNLVMIAGIRLRMYLMADITNSILVTIRQELYTHI